MDDKAKIKYRLIFYAILSVFLIISLATLSDYGMTWDEAAQHHVGQVTIDFLKGKTTDFNFQRDDLKYYGPFFEMINYYFSSSLLESFNISYVSAFHILIILTAGLGLLFLFWLTSALLGEQIALLSCTFLMLLPRYAAHAQYNSKDIPLATFFIIVLFFLYSGFSKRKIRHVILAGVFLGLGIATRMDLILVLPVFFIAYSLHLIFEKKILANPKIIASLKPDFISLAIVSFFGLLAAFIAWPVLWKSPKILIESFFFFLHHTWQGQIFYFNQFYTAASLPWHYAPFFILTTLPLVILILFSGGLYKIGRELKQKKNIFIYSLLLSWILIRIIIALLPGAIRYDGMRHFLMIMPAITIIAAIGLSWLLALIKEKFSSQYKKISIVIISIIFLSLTTEFIRIYPFGDSYFNEITRLAIPSHIENHLEIEYWGATYRQGVDWLNKNASSNSSFCVTAAEHLLQFYPIRPDLLFSCNPAQADYLMFFTRKTTIPEDLNKVFNYSSGDPVFKISRINSDLLYIYKLNKP